MPYTMAKTNGQDCPERKPWVVLNADTGKPVPGGCHETRAEAQAHMAALQSNVPEAGKRP